jgi:hypothetical protein
VVKGCQDGVLVYQETVVKRLRKPVAAAFFGDGVQYVIVILKVSGLSIAFAYNVYSSQMGSKMSVCHQHLFCKAQFSLFNLMTKHTTSTGHA